MNQADPTPEPTPDPDAADANLNSLAEALAHWNVELDQSFHEPIDAYCRTLWDWNSKMNLTRHDTYEKFVARDLVDTLELSKQIPIGKRVLDVGTGGGVPGMVLAIIRPDLDVTLCDSVTKKAKAVAEMAETLQLPVAVAHARAQEVLDITSFDIVTARAVGSLKKILTWFQESWDSIGTLLLIKGPKWVDERGEARHHGLMAGMDLRKIAEYPTPGAEWNSVILSLEPKD